MKGMRPALGHMTSLRGGRNSRRYLMFWRINRDALNYKVLADDGNTYDSHDLLQFGDIPVYIDVNKLTFSESDDQNLPSADFYPFKPGILAASSKVFDIFDEEIRKSEHVFYKAKNRGLQFDILVVEEELNGFDYDRSVYELFPDGEIWSVDRLFLKSDFRTNLDIFRLKDEFSLRFELIVSERFKNKYDDFSLTGLRFFSTQ